MELQQIASLNPKFAKRTAKGLVLRCIYNWRVRAATLKRSQYMMIDEWAHSRRMVVEMGPACLIGLDREKRELLAFIGTAIDKRTFQNVLIPLFCELTTEVFPTSATLASAVHNEASGNA